MRARARGPLLKYHLHASNRERGTGDLRTAVHLIFQSPPVNVCVFGAGGGGEILLLIIFQEKRFVSTHRGFCKSVNRILKLGNCQTRKTLL